MKIKVGDLVEMVPKNYSSPGINVEDQWKGCLGIITKQIDVSTYVLLVQHPDEPSPMEITVAPSDVVLSVSK